MRQIVTSGRINFTSCVYLMPQEVEQHHSVTEYTPVHTHNSIPSRFVPLAQRHMLIPADFKKKNLPAWASVNRHPFLHKINTRPECDGQSLLTPSIQGNQLQGASEIPIKVAQLTVMKALAKNHARCKYVAHRQAQPDFGMWRNAIITFRIFIV